MENYKRWLFVKPYEKEGEENPIPRGTEVTVMGNNVYVNGGMVGPGYRELLLGIIMNEKLRMTYLREVVIPYNKI